MADGVHPAAAVGFTAAVDVYESARPTVPAEAVDWLLEQLGVGAGDVVLEIGAGTGKFTRLLVERDVQVLAIEPVAAMRERLAVLGDRVTRIDALAEQLPLDAGAAKAAVAVQAFHWVDAPRVLLELERVLVPGGRLGLVWNRRDSQAVAWPADLDALLDAVRGDTPHSQDGRWTAAVEASEHYHLEATRSWPWTQVQDAKGFVDRVASISFVASLPEADRARLLAEARAIAVRHLGTDDPAASIDVPYVAEVFVIAPAAR